MTLARILLIAHAAALVFGLGGLLVDKLAADGEGDLGLREEVFTATLTP